MSGSVTSGGRPVEAANVFLLETLEGALTDASGGFSFETSRVGGATLVILRAGLVEERRPVDLPAKEPIAIELLEVVSVESITVRAGGYTAGDEPGASLTSLEVVTTPGSGASVAGAIRALPGVQSVDDGTGLFVRGGDQTETRFFLNEAGLIDALRPEEPTGSAAPQIDPFLLDGIFFSSGAFGARYGNALSAVVDLESRGRPDSFVPEIGAHMAGIEGGIQGPIGDRLGGALTVSRLHVGPIHAINGSARDYETTPQGWETSGSLVWEYGVGGEVKAFAIGQTFEAAVDVEEASFDGVFETDAESGAAIVTWRDRLGGLAPVVSVSRSSSRSRQAGGAFRLRDERASTQIFASVTTSVGNAVALSAGGEFERLETSLDGAFPVDAANRGEGAEVDLVDVREDTDRVGGFTEVEWAPTSRLAVTAGLRSDRSTLAEARTWDPRLSLAWSHPSGVSLLLGGGVYHQVPDPLLYARSPRDEPLAPMRATQVVAGIQAGHADDRLVRVEMYVKEYDDLAGLDREDRAVGGGEGRSVGLDLFLKGEGPWGTRGWVSYSLVDAERTDPDTRETARAPFDVTHGLALVASKAVAPGWSVRAAWRYATGRPFTDVVDAVFDAERGLWVPVYGRPFAERLPAIHRLDLSASRLVAFGDDGLIVLFASLGNVYDRGTVLGYRWSADYSERFPVPGRSQRSVFAGVSIEF